MKNPIITIVVGYYKAKRWIALRRSRPTTFALPDLGIDMTEEALRELLRDISGDAGNASDSSSTNAMRGFTSVRA